MGQWERVNEITKWPAGERVECEKRAWWCYLNHCFWKTKTLSPQKPKPLAAARPVVCCVVFRSLSLFFSFPLFSLSISFSLCFAPFRVFSTLRFWGLNPRFRFGFRASVFASVSQGEPDLVLDLTWLPLLIPRIVSLFFCAIFISCLLSWSVLLNRWLDLLPIRF